MTERLRSRGKFWQPAALAIAVVWLTGGCVGDQSSPQDERAREPADPSVPAMSGYRGPVADTAQLVSYQVLETQVESESPRKVEYWLVTTEVTGTASWSKTLRLALDSIAAADSTLVAARGILYLLEPIDDRRGRLTPRVWGEWLPAAGWNDAGEESRGELHRIYTYNQRPDW
jgi:hypothetical protein